MARFWLFDWFDENEIGTAEQIDTILNESRQFKVLQAAAASAGYRRPSALENDNGIVAGRGIDLTGVGSCLRHRSCVRRQVDVLLRRCWHYFDEVVVDDMTPALARASYKKLNREAVAGWLEALLYLKSVGGERLVRFAAKNIYCSKCHREHAVAHFHSDMETMQADLSATFERDLTISFRPSESSKEYVEALLVGPYLDGGYSQQFAKTKIARKSDADVKHMMVASLLDTALMRLADDCITAEKCKAPLGSATKLESFLLQYSGAVEGDMANSVAFSLALPYIEHVPVGRLLQIREEEHAAFDAFRSRLRVAIHERVKNSDAIDVESVSKEIKQDLIDPELSKLRLALARNAGLLQKEVVGASLGFFGGVIGLLAAPLQPLAAGSIATGLALSNAAINAYKERSALKSSELYFLLEAERDHE